ncbi:aromatase/cyclase [Streptomyces sparsogenes]|uniref:Actinorhodin polyketide synthase bifunctional cyclase/dehydratase n=1 Tax=Streptomyces sparsogenes DSM 40356 TaxID=1331668 RepID=A0A1R1S787_9ACTN|nr:aromatase/cyclase [Streptomyces sparsogenes]OMI33979.1 actinorhodin polyketide synthase bifunctional cyclase/dehydratase [Streptomyces sparsogenes DSM 40356]
MTTTDTYLTTHGITVLAPARTVYGIIADVADWPQRFAPNVHVEHLERTPGAERIRIWATAGGEVKSWTSRRELDPHGLRVTFRQELSAPPVAAMGGEWTVTSHGDHVSRLELRHDFRAVDDDPAGVRWITSAVDRNSESELAAVKALAELGDSLGELEFSFEDTVFTTGDPALVYDYLYRADLWPERLPHVSRLDLKEDPAGQNTGGRDTAGRDTAGRDTGGGGEPRVQVMAMDTRTADGSVHTTESVRVCFAPDRIVYKQTTVPALMTAHTGSWTITPAGDGAAVTSRHTVILDPGAVERVLGPGRTVADARTYVQRALSANSTTTLRHAREFAEATARG